MWWVKYLITCLVICLTRFHVLSLSTYLVYLISLQELTHYVCHVKFTFHHARERSEVC